MAKQSKGKNNSEQRQKCQQPNIQRELPGEVTDKKARAGQQEYMEQLMEYQWQEK